LSSIAETLKMLEKMATALRNIEIEANRPQGNAVHLKRVVALQATKTLKEYGEFLDDYA
jgi:hypothetical protein